MRMVKVVIRRRLVPCKVRLRSADSPLGLIQIFIYVGLEERSDK